MTPSLHPQPGSSPSPLVLVIGPWGHVPVHMLSVNPPPPLAAAWGICVVGLGRLSGAPPASPDVGWGGAGGGGGPRGHVHPPWVSYTPEGRMLWEPCGVPFAPEGRVPGPPKGDAGPEDGSQQCSHYSSAQMPAGATAHFHLRPAFPLSTLHRLSVGGQSLHGREALPFKTRVPEAVPRQSRYRK